MKQVIEVGRGADAPSRVVIGDAINSLENYLPSGRKVVIVTDPNVHRLYKEIINRYDYCLIGLGEPNKTLGTAGKLYGELLARGADRSTFLVGFGGGIVTDVTGFVASTYMRGLRFGFVATTLLAQVDASVGGKTGVDLPFGKNLVGAFHQPRLVVADPETLHTLPDYDFTDGMGEVIKYGCIMDAALFEKLEKGEVIDRMEAAIAHCVACKKVLVEEDTNDKGRRMILNFGHTFGHALEKLTGFSSLSHGRAVAIGMAMAADVGESLGVTEMGTAARIRRVLESYDLPVESDFDFADIVEATALDKKSFGKTLNLILLKSIGDCVIHPIDRSYLVLRYKIAAEQNRRRK